MKTITRNTNLIKILLLTALIPNAVFATDRDSDGWADEVDAYPNHKIVSQPVTNVLLQHGYDAESNTEQWKTFTWASIDGLAEIKTTLGHDGNSTQAFHLQATTDEAEKMFGFDGPTLTMLEGKEVNHVRLSAWIKYEGPEGATAPTANLGVFYTGGGVVRNFRNNSYYNQGWVYSEFDFHLRAPAKSIAIKLMMAQQTGYDFWVDDITLNFISRQDSDGDTIIDALDTDDDNDGILDGKDDTPLGDLSLDLDTDGIIDGYDDDLDNDGIVNALDALDLMPYVEITANTVDGITTLTAQAIEWPTDAVIDYIWSLDGVELAEQGNLITINEADYAPSTALNVTVTATDGDVTTTSRPHPIMTPANIEPTLELTVTSSDSLSKFEAIATDADDHALQYRWSINGVEQTESGHTFSVVNSDYERGATIEVSVSVFDGYASISQVKAVNIPVNQVPNIDLLTTITDDNAVLVATVTDADGDEIVYQWYINGELQASNSKEFTVENDHHTAGKAITIKVTAFDGFDSAEKSTSIAIPEEPLVKDVTDAFTDAVTETDDEPLIGGSIILTLIASLLIFRRK